MNIELLKEKYIALVPQVKEKFISELAELKKKLDCFELDRKPLLIYNRNQRNALYYILCMRYSLMSDRILDYAITTGQTYIDQHFMNDEKDKLLYESLRYSDIAFISLSQFDYTNQYLESLLIELVEFRRNMDKLTVISYDIVDSFNYEKTTAKLITYFTTNDYKVINLSNKADSFIPDIHSVESTKPEPKQEQPKKGRIK